MKNFAERLKKIAEALEIEHQEIAEKGGVSKQAFSSYIRNGKLPQLKTVANWVEELEINANWLLTGRGGMFINSSPSVLETKYSPEMPSDDIAQRMHVFSREMERIGASKEEIKAGLLALSGVRPATSASDHVWPHESNYDELPKSGYAQDVQSHEDDKI